MKVKLIVLSEGPVAGKAIPITLPQFIIGRDKQCHLRPVSTLISKRHCALLIRNNAAWIRDFDSTNGTFLNDEPVKGEEKLKDGDILKVGPLIFRVELQQPVAVDKPTPPPGKSLDHIEDDESIAALLLDDDGSIHSSAEKGLEPEVSEGTTMMDMMMPPEMQEQAKKEKEQKQKEEKAKDDKKGDTSAAAADILTKMYRRR